MASGVFTATATKNGGTWTIRAYYSYTNQSSVTVTLTVAGYSGAHSWTNTADAYWGINGSQTWTTFDFSGTTEYTIGSKTFYNVGSSFKITGVFHAGNGYSYMPSHLEVSGTINDIPPVWTNCTAPTSVSISNNGQSVAIPGDTITISWSGAKNGTSNAITSYGVYYYFSSNKAAPTTSTYSGYKSVSSSSSSTTISITEANRGLYLRASVRAVSQHNTTGLANSSNSSVIAINQRPDAPSLLKTSWVFKSTDSNITITGITAGNANFGASGQTVHYSTSSNTISTEVVTNKEIIAKEGIYYFWTYDGREYSSSYVTATVSKNIKPKLETCKIEKEVLSTVYRKTEIFSGALEEVSFNLKGNKNLKYKIEISYSENNVKKTYLLKNNQSLGTSEVITETFYPRALNLPQNISYSFKITPQDDYEIGNSVELNKIYKIPPLPEFLTYYNQRAYSNAPHTQSNNFGDELRILFSYDSYFVKNGKISLVAGEGNFSGTIMLGSRLTVNDLNTSSVNVNLIASDSLIFGKEYNIVLRLSLNNQTVEKTIEGIKRTPILDPTPSSGSSFLVKPFTSGLETADGYFQELKISTEGSKSFGSVETFYNNYNLDSNKWWKTELIINNNTLNITDFIRPLKVSEINSSDYITRTFSTRINNDNSAFFNSLKDIIPKEQRQGKITGILRNTITNGFGKAISGQAALVTLDFEETADYQVKDNNLGTYSFLYEGYNIEIPLTIETYSMNSVTFEVLIKRGENGNFVNYIGPETVNYTGESIEFGSPRVVTRTLKKEIGEIQDSEDCYFSIRILDGSKEITTSWDNKIAYKRLKSTTPSLTFIKAEYSNYSDDEGKVATSFSNLDFGYDNTQVRSTGSYSFKISQTLNFSLQTKDSPTPSLTDINKGSFSYITSKINDFKNGELLLTVTIKYFKGEEKIVELTKTGISNTYTVYGISPTVAYRTNHLGINTTLFNDNDILVIAPSSNRYVIRLRKVGSENESFTINLKTGTLEGFIFNIDCGEITNET